MATREELLTELYEIKYAIGNNNYNAEHAESVLRKIDSMMSGRNILDLKVKSSIIKSLMINFNISNFSDLTALLHISKDRAEVVEYAGNHSLLSELNTLLDNQNLFYKDLDSISIKGDNFKVFYESMENDNGIYTVITFTESFFFKPSKFHMLCDILMDLIRSARMSENSVYNDLFENMEIGINSRIESGGLNNAEFYLFRFDNINDLFNEMGLELIIELFESIKRKITEITGSGSVIIRFTLSEYIVVKAGISAADKMPPMINDSGLSDINFKGIALQCSCMKIPYGENKSVYDLFENIYLLNNDLR